MVMGTVLIELQEYLWGGGSAHDHSTERALCECCAGIAVNDRARTDLMLPSRGEEVIQQPSLP